MSHQDELLPPTGLQTWHEPRKYQDFHCAGAACEDTCCQGWGIGVDRQTYDRYQQVTDPELGPKLRELVNISTNIGSQHAAITLHEGQCPFLLEQLCGIQARLGEEFLGQACATYPRVVNRVEGAVERSLDISCPEAARLVLLNPEPDFFQQFRGVVTPGDSRLLQIVAGRVGRPFPPYFDAVRGFLIGILQNRDYPVAKRLMLLGFVCAKLQELEDNNAQDQTPEVLEGFRYAIQARMFDEHLRHTSANAGSQLALVLELVVARISLDYTSPRYRALYGEFSEGLHLEANSTIPELAGRYATAYRQYFEPFLATHEHILEHYLVSYAYKTLLPYGNGSMAGQYMVMASYFAITRSLAVGLAARHQAEFSEAHLVRVIQVCARAMEHCTSFPARLLGILEVKGIRVPGAMAVLTQGVAPASEPEQGPEIDDSVAGFKSLEYASGR